MSTYDCPALLQQLFDAIHDLQMQPARPVRIKHKDREVEYSVTDLNSMMNLYRVHWNNCGVEAGLPPLDKTATVRRGRPIRPRF